jgi:tRNA U54 and U55 pseudouridine synthase Pus10
LAILGERYFLGCLSNARYNVPDKTQTWRPAIQKSEGSTKENGRRKIIESRVRCHTTKQRKKMISDAKDKPCAVCKQAFPVVAMDLHHTDPTIKEFSISTALNKVGYEKLQKEIEKCIPLCAICHRLLHAGLVELEI